MEPRQDQHPGEQGELEREELTVGAMQREADVQADHVPGIDQPRRDNRSDERDPERLEALQRRGGGRKLFESLPPRGDEASERRQRADPQRG